MSPMSESTVSCETLFKELLLLSNYYSGFPKLWEHYLSSSKLHQLILLLKADGTEASPSPIFQDVYWLRVTDLEQSIALFVDEDGYVSSAKVLASLTVYLSGLENYHTARLDHPASTIFLDLEPDSAPTFGLTVVIPVHDDANTLKYYLRPNGSGNWQRITPEAVAQL